MIDTTLDLNKFPNNPLDNDGITTIYEDTHSIHPMVDIDYKSLLKGQIDKDKRLSKCFGSQETLKSSIECNMCSKSRRLPGIKSSMLSLEILMGKLDDIESHEYMNTIKPKNEYGFDGIHSYIEKSYNI